MEQEMETKERNKRVVELLTRKDEIGDELATLGEKTNALGIQRAEVEEELAELLGIQRTNGAAHPAPTRSCRLCGQTGHIIARTKTGDGRDTCPTYPNGKPQEE